MLLNSATQKLVAVLTSAKTTYDLPITVNYAETVTAPFSFSGKPVYTFTNGLTTVDLLQGVAGKELTIKKLSVYGKDTAAKGFRLGVVDFTSPVTAGSFAVGRPYQITAGGSTDFTLIGAANSTPGTIFDATGVGTGTGTASPFYQELDLVLQVDDTLCYDAQGWYTVDAQGNLKSVQAASATAIATAIHSATNKITPVGADEVGIWDSVSGLLNRVSFTNIWNWVASQIQSGSPVAITATLTGTEYAATPSPAITAYTANQAFDVTFASACPAAPTLKLNGIATPPNLVRQNVDGTYSNLAAGAFPAGWRSTVRAISASQVLVDRLPPRRKILTATRDVSLASGNISYTGAGFRPRKVTLRVVIHGTNAWANGSNVGITGGGIGANGSYCLYGNNPVGANVSQDTYLGLIYVAAGSWNYIDVVSFDSGGITLTFAKNGTPTGTATLLLELEE